MRVRARIDDAETIYSLPVLDDSRRVIGIVSLRDLLRAVPSTTVSEIMQDPDVATAYQTAEIAARKCAGLGHRSEEHTSELQSRGQLVCRLQLEKKKRSS